MQLFFLFFPAGEGEIAVARSFSFSFFSLGKFEEGRRSRERTLLLSPVGDRLREEGGEVRKGFSLVSGPELISHGSHPHFFFSFIAGRDSRDVAVLRSSSFPFF